MEADKNGNELLETLASVGKIVASTTGTILLLVASISFVWYLAWKLILHQIPIFREIMGFAGFTTKPPRRPRQRKDRKGIKDSSTSQIQPISFDEQDKKDIAVTSDTDTSVHVPSRQSKRLVNRRVSFREDDEIVFVSND
ncbi:hypothetical protein DFS34DRAFT_687292 [Phlyctochytrium arcticum]|nr:hypothetical protein DFS34DRAFT_687292 [Phlyctochytrium arcticum]